jgi:hypothetical protein
MSSEKKQNSFREKVIEAIDQILPITDVAIEEIKEEVWRDLSALYYKYEDEDQKTAFREVMREISERIGQGRWELVYKKLYRLGQKGKSF